IGSPWAIRAPGFFTDGLHQDRLHFGFVSAGDYTPSGSAQPDAMPAQPVNGLPATVEQSAGAPVAPAGASAPAGAAAPVDSSGYVSPLPRDANIGRTDMGVDVDLRAGEPIVAPGNSKVLGIEQNWYAGQPYIGLQFLDGPLKGHNYYIAEQIDP